jgi:hypothetical protein
MTEKRTRMTGSDPFPCALPACGHDIEQHHPAYDYGQVDVCLGKTPDGSRCPCDGFRFKASTPGVC